MEQSVIETIIEDFDEIESGITLKRTRELGIHEYCKRRRITNGNKTSYLYFLTQQWSDYITSRRDLKSSNDKELTQVKEILNELESQTTQFDDIKAQDSSSFLIDDEPKNKLAQNIYRSFTRGECATANTFYRSILLHYVFQRLCTSGIASSQIIAYDLYGILIDYLQMTKENTYVLMDEARIHFEYLISTFYKAHPQN